MSEAVSMVCPVAAVECTAPCTSPTSDDASPLLAASQEATRQRELELCSALCDCIAILTAGDPEDFQFGGVSSASTRSPFDGVEALAAGSAALDPAAGTIETLMRVALERLGVAVTADQASAEAHQMLMLMLNADVPAQLLAHLGELGFEAQKDAMRLFGAALQSGGRLGAEGEIAAYVRARPDVVTLLLDGCSSPDAVLHCGHMLRVCFRNHELVQVLLEAGAIERLTELARHPCFEVSSDAFASLKELLLNQSDATSVYLVDHFAAFFGLFHRLVLADDYATQRQALRLLGEVLLNGGFTAVMMAYVGEERFLQIHMNLLLNPSASIQIGAFHVFKIFVANPDKPARVELILRKNRTRLMRLLQGLMTLREDDEPFEQDVHSLLALLGAMKDHRPGQSARVPVSDENARPAPPGENVEPSHARRPIARATTECCQDNLGDSGDEVVRAKTMSAVY